MELENCILRKIKVLELNKTLIYKHETDYTESDFKDLILKKNAEIDVLYGIITEYQSTYKKAESLTKDKLEYSFSDIEIKQLIADRLHISDDNLNIIFNKDYSVKVIVKK